MLDVDAWEHAPALLAVYDYVLRLLATANLMKAGELVAEAQHLLAEIGDAFRTAAAAAPAPAPAATATTYDPSSPGLSIRA